MFFRLSSCRRSSSGKSITMRAIINLLRKKIYDIRIIYLFWLIFNQSSKAGSLILVRAFDLFRQDRHATLNLLRIRYVVHPHALMGMRPFMLQPREEIVAGYHQHATFFQALVQQFSGNRQILEPQPEENCPFRFMDQAAFW
ncbi:hypothetical protein D3C80_1751260 [compost metagenome]